MSATAKLNEERDPSLAASAIIFVSAVAVMLVLRFQVFPDRLISLSYNLPLLFCLWHRDSRLLWSLVAAFMGMSAYKAFFFMPDPNPADSLELTQWLFQVCNIVAGGVAVQLTITFARNLRDKNAQLARANEELAARGAEIEQQNEELNEQAEELTQQNEEIRAQGEELENQNEELTQQNEELTASRRHAAEREAMLQTLLNSMREPGDFPELLDNICQAAHKLLADSASAVVLVEQDNGALVVRARSGIEELAEERWPYASSFASLVVEQNRTAFVADLAQRPDLHIAQPKGGRFCSILGTPLIAGGKPIGAVEALSREPRRWNAGHFAIVEWVAAQAGLIIEASGARARLEGLVRERTAKLEEMINELQHFSYTITHDMRAPLRSLQGFAAILQDPAENLSESERSDYLGRIITSAARMDQLIVDALNYSRAVQEQLPLEPVDTARLLRGILDSYPSLQPPNVEIRIDGPLPLVLANEAGLTQCFSNLLTNAAKFVAPGTKSRVRIYSQCQNNHARISFEDNGIGIPEAMRPKLFHMFQRASREYEGTGIGLALVRKVTERMGGAVGFESQPGKGSRFWLKLKLASASPGVSEQPPPAQPATSL